MPPKRKHLSAKEPAKSKARPKRSKKTEEEDVQPKFGLEWQTPFPPIEPSSELPPLIQLVHPENKLGSEKIAGFDLDYTLIRPKSGRKWPTGPKDWEFLYDVKEKLTAIHKDGYQVVIITNQRGMEKGYTKPQDFMKKITDIVNALDIPVMTFAATGENHFRKPGTLMWDHMVANHNKGIKVDLSKSYYVGDAAGRAKGWAKDKPRDFSCSDRMFAANIGIPFHTPEEYFEGDDVAPFTWLSCDPAHAVTKGQSVKREAKYHSKDKELIIMHGFPASGKSSFYRHHLQPHGYVWVNRDTLHTPAKCVEAAKTAIGQGKSVVIDNTNPKAADRLRYLELITKKDYKARCFIMDTPLEMAHHLNMVRQNYTDGKHRRVPGVGFNMFKKNCQEPLLKEGFTEIVRIPFVPIFEDKKHETLFKQWTD